MRSLPDHHTHHLRCGHAVGSLDDVAASALVRGLPAVGLSDHAPLLFLPGDHPAPLIAMPASEFPAYAEEMQHVKARYAGRLRVLASVEADYVPGSEAAYRHLLASPLDYVLGSVHWIDGWSLFSAELPGGWTPEHAWSRALALTREAAASGFADVIAHLDVLKTKGHLPERWHTPELDDTLEAIGASGKAIELNTSGWRKPVGECFPSPAILHLAARRGIPVCLGSDAHDPQDVGADFERAARVLYDAGYRETVTWEGRERRVIPLA
ncbi:histidinol-phosphatase HisJ family protein [Deinococcus ruber]|uniref:Histidinol-phosphatase n=1 Tax=Deinococcus ruber TaxID=1848197 RepID=A0A918C739_9DEIO|nr:histidinol-phosphatase HisJ family protein [Deinococcus ruber]GGR08076.1 putative histidinol-phosphatase [Deinococcus ruber]